MAYRWPLDGTGEQIGNKLIFVFSMALIQCPECGHMISDRAAKCPKCGCPVKQETAPSPNRVVSNGDVYDSHPKTASHKWLYIVVGVLIAALVGGGIIAYNKLSNNEEVHPASTTPDSTSNVVVQGILDSMVDVEGGTFLMGATSEQSDGANEDEYPVHTVSVSSFSIASHEVTQDEWEAVMGYNPSMFKGNRRPVDYVNWRDCQEFIDKLNALSGKHFRLPTEAEWEFAARGGNRSRGYTYSGSNNINSVAWYGSTSDSRTHEVNSKSPNELGLYDMTGNLWEWCADWYGNYGSNDQTNPTGPNTGSTRAIRGGGWNGGKSNCRVSNRDGREPDYRSDRLGLRLVVDD